MMQMIIKTYWYMCWSPGRNSSRSYIVNLCRWCHLYMTDMRSCMLIKRYNKTMVLKVLQGYFPNNNIFTIQWVELFSHQRNLRNSSYAGKEAQTWWSHPGFGNSGQMSPEVQNRAFRVPTKMTDVLFFKKKFIVIWPNSLHYIPWHAPSESR